MSQENVEIVRRSVDAFLRGDFDGAMQAFHPDIAVRHHAHPRPTAKYNGGHEGFRTGLRRWVGAWDDYRMEVDEYVDAGDSVVIFFRAVRPRERAAACESSRVSRA